MRQKPKPITLEEYMAQKAGKTSNKTLLQQKYANILNNASGENEAELADKYDLKVGKYSLRTRIRNNPWLKSGRPANKALQWLHKEVFKNPAIYKHRQLLMYSGGLFTFEYLNPKYKDTKQLPWFDKYPLVLSLGAVVTEAGIRNIGFNLHLVPPRIRIIIICHVFEIYKNLYRYQIFFNKNKPVKLSYKVIVKSLRKYGADFCIRMYIPQRQRQIVVFPYRDWYKAIFVPSRGYDGIKAAKLIQQWTKHLRKLGFSTTASVDWNKSI